MSTVEWPNLAAWYDEKQGEVGDFWRRTHIPLHCLIEARKVS